jgi:hypothetical protein
LAVWYPNLRVRNAVVLEESYEVVVVPPDVTDDSLIAGVTILDKRAIVIMRSPS